MAEPLELIIFDNDGVLVDSEPHAHPVLVSVLRQYGYALSEEESVRRFLGTSIGHVRDAVEDELGRQLPSDFEAQYHDRLFARFGRGLQAVPGIKELIEDLEVSYCVASSGSVERIRHSLSLVGLWPFFEGRAFSSDEVAHAKPAPDLFLHVARVLDVPPPRCLVVEDSAHGIEAARRAGMRCVGFAARTPSVRLSEATEGVVFSTDALKRLLHRLLDSARTGT